MKNVIPSETFKDGLKGQVKQEGEYFEMDHEVQIKLDDTDWENADASVEPCMEIHNKDDCEESMKYFQESEIGKIEQQHKDDLEILKNQHRQELEIEKEKRKVDIKEKEMYLRENQRLKADNLRLKRENNRRMGDELKLLKVTTKARELEEKIRDLIMEKEEGRKKHQNDNIELDKIMRSFQEFREKRDYTTNENPSKRAKHS